MSGRPFNGSLAKFPKIGLGLSRVSMVANGPAAMPGNLGGEFNIPVLFHKVLDRLHPKD